MPVAQGAKYFKLTQNLDLDPCGNPEPLRFPPFHQEMLTQSWWNAGEDLGRIKVIIAEGLINKHRASPFERFKNLVAFSFQHAPLSEIHKTAPVTGSFMTDGWTRCFGGRRNSVAQSGYVVSRTRLVYSHITPQN